MKEILNISKKYIRPNPENDKIKSLYKLSAFMVER
jgi:hypothetical protein